MPLSLAIQAKNMLTVLKAQQDPHCPWFLIGVTYPCFLQSTSVGKEAMDINLDPFVHPLAFGIIWLVNMDLNSSFVCVAKINKF